MSALDVMTETAFRENLDRVLEDVTQNVGHVIVTRDGGRPIVIMAYDELRSWEETVHLTSNPANAKNLQEAIAEMDAGNGIERDLVEVDERMSLSNRS